MKTFNSIASSTFALVLSISSASALDCPQGNTPEAIERFRNEAASLLTSSSSTSEVEEALNRCFNNQVPACVNRIGSYVQQRNAVSSSQYDTQAGNDDRKRPPRDLLGDLSSNGTMEIVSDVERVAAERQYLSVRYKSRHAGGFDSDTPSLLMIRVLGSQVNPPVPYDRYINFALPVDESAEAMNPMPQKDPVLSPEELSRNSSGAPSQFTVWTITRPQNGQRAEVTFQKYGRSGSEWRPDAPAGMGCYSCHPGGLRAISPLGYHVRKLENGQTERQMPSEEWLKVKDMNATMDTAAGGRIVSWRGAEVNGTYRSFLVPEGIGPVIGPVSPLTKVTLQREGQPSTEVALTRQKEFIMGGEINGVRYEGCYKAREEVSTRDIFGRAPGRNNVYRLTQNPPIAWTKVRDAMNCASCHNNAARGALNDRTDYSQIDFKILTDQSMPNGHHVNPMDVGNPNAPVQDRLNANERIALANCLKVEFESYERPKVKEWLMDTRCSTGVTPFMPERSASLLSTPLQHLFR